jgi:hypothetical protein
VFAQADRFAPAVLKQLPSCGPASARVMIRVLGLAGAGTESAIGRHLVHPDALVRKEAFHALVRVGSPLAASVTAQRLHDAAPAVRAAALDALRQFPSGEVFAELQRLVRNREFLVRSPEVVSQLLDHVARSGPHDIRPILDELEALRFRFWNREALRAVRRARELRRR